MRKELRGKDIKHYNFDNYLNIKRVIEDHFNNAACDVDEKRLLSEYGFDVSSIKRASSAPDKIKESILELYNNEISSSVIFLYVFLSWYRESSIKIENAGYHDDKKVLLDFSDTLSRDTVTNVDMLLKVKIDGNTLEEIKKHYQYKIISAVKKQLPQLNETELYIRILHIIKTAVDNVKYLKLIDDKEDTVNTFLLQLEYYPVDKTFREVIDTFDSEQSKPTYEELKGHEFQYYNAIKNTKVGFSSIKPIYIKKEGKKRKVYIARTPIDQAALIYLSKRLNKEFHITYPNRDKIMELSFNLIDSLPRLDNYTVYKFDFKNFFESVEIKDIYEKYIKNSNLYTYEKEMILLLAGKYKCCAQGMPVSNALIEIISREFDESIRAIFSDDGLIFYKRYVDDCILIFNHRIPKSYLVDAVNLCRIRVFGESVKLSKAKTSYQTKFDGDVKFDYLGYSFTRRYWPKQRKIQEYYYFQFGIAEKKIEKYRKQVDEMFDSYIRNGKERLLLRRIQYFDSRVVFYNYEGSKYVNKSTWDVRGIINSYRMLRRYVIFEDQNLKSGEAGKTIPHRIDIDTYDFLRYYIRKKRDSLATVPDFLQGKGCDYHTLWNGFIKNKSIVFQPNIGWSSQYLSGRLLELGIIPYGKSYYEKTRDYYTELIKKLQR